MWNWLKRIRKVRFWWFELELFGAHEIGEGPHDYSPRDTGQLPASPPPPVTAKPIGIPCLDQADVPSGSNPRFTVHGDVIRTTGKDLGIRVWNEAALRSFWKEQQMGTDLDWFGKGPPVVSINRQADIQRCRLGDRASLTFEVVARKDGKRGVKAVDFKVDSDPDTDRT